ncbi:transposase [Petroclostridium sp. X23]|nr:transposase [Petroclostridium sp. X23]WHH61591.1 transposase [Petroclostridium sp. X23]WHH61694.1 transposase [Petroclostridium sp. X23]WHH61747.1 transposase [Petroclostridium sp. X23]WHH61764.1 transposase [Petroclostridium sp. X23]WHH61779.1 transposase [Petroclostridium sp. X23]
MEIIQLLLFPKECFKCIKTYNYFICYIWCLLVVPGKKTTRKLYRHCFFFRKDVSSWCRFFTEYKWDYTEVIRKMFLLLLNLFPNELMVHGKIQACFDTTLNAKDSKKVIGIQKWDNHSGNADAGEYIIGHHWGVLGITGFFKNQYISFLISFKLVTGKLAKSQWKCNQSGQAEPLKIWDVAHAQILQLNQWVLQSGHKLRTVEDAYFANKPFIQPLLDQGIDVVTKLRADAVARLDPEPQSQKKRGRKPKYGKQIKVRELWNLTEHEIVTVQLYGKIQTIEIAVADVCMLKLSKKVRTVVLHTNKGKLMALISTDTTLTAAQIIEIYGSRFSIELAIRDVKQYLGFGEYQHHSLLPVLRFLHTVGIAYNIGKIVLIKYGKCKWLNITSDTGDTPWVSELSFSKLRYCLRKYALGKLVFADSAPEAEQHEIVLDKDAIVDFVA